MSKRRSAGSRFRRGKWWTAAAFVLLGLGFLTSVATGLLIVNVHHWRDASFRKRHDAAFQAEHVDRFADRERRLFIVVHDGRLYRSVDVATLWADDAASGVPTGRTPWWSQLERIHANEPPPPVDAWVRSTGPVVRTCEHAFGWPWPMLSFTEVHLPDAGKDITINALRSIGVDVRSLHRHEWTVEKQLDLEIVAAGAGTVWAPTRVLPAYALANSAAYGASWFALLAVLVGGPRWMRGVVRRRRGKCARCGYDLRGTGGAACPECGKGM